MKKTLSILGILILALGVFVYMLFAKHENQKYDFRFDKVSQGDLMVYVTATGTINALISVDVGTQVSGIVTKLYADFNSVVKAGEVIARIDTTFLYQSVKDAEASLDRARAQFADSKRNSDRISDLFKKGLESELNYSSALTTYESNQASLKQAQAALDRAKINLAYATIYAPINGVVIDRKVNVGQTVAASFSSPTLFTIANDLKRMQVQTTVDESDVGKISIGQQATFTVDAYPDERFTGEVSQIRLAPQSIQNVVNYVVIIDVQNEQLKLMPGMTANVKILVANATGVLRVPNMALRFQPPGDIVDTTGSSAVRNGPWTRSERGNDQESTGRGAATTGDVEGGSPGQLRQSKAHGADRTGTQSDDGRKGRFEALRDSIQKARRRTLTQDELRAEMRKMFEQRTGSGQQASLLVRPKQQSATSDAAKFGIVSNFPEYQKSAYIPSHQSGRGRIWILKPNGLLEQIPVRTGLNDGRYTEITSPRLSAGDQIVIGASSADASGDQARNPLMGQGQGRPMGGGFGR